MPLQFSSDVRHKAKSYLSFCYRQGVIGPYRRVQSAWILSDRDGHLMLDDYEVVSFLEHALEQDPDLEEAFGHEMAV